MEIGSLLLNQRFAVPIVPYTEADLRDDLAQGVGNVLAGIGSDYRFQVSADSGTVLIKHKDVDTGAGAGAGYSGALRCALGLTANGLIAGYNRKSDGAWVNSLVIDATTGSPTFNGTINAIDGNFSGTINAGAIIAGGALVNGTSMLTILNGASAGATAVQPAAIANMLTRTSSYILGGTMTVSTTDAGAGIRTGNIAWDSYGNVNAGTGVAITAKGIVGASNGVVTFSIDSATGSPTFKGDITGSTGAFSGTVSGSNITGGTINAALSINSSGSINATGTYGSSLGAVSICGVPSTTSIIGVAGISGSNDGVAGQSTSGNGVRGISGTGSGVRGQGATGVTGIGQGTGALDLLAGNSGRIGLGGSSVQIRGTGGLIRMTDAYTTDAFMIMATAVGPGSGSIATLGPVLGTNPVMKGWITVKVAGGTAIVPYWQLS